MDQLSGVIERITFHNEETGFCVLKIKSKGFSDLVTVVGSLASVTVGSSLRMEGEWKVNSKYGKQFAVAHYEETLPATAAAIEKYLGSGLIKGIGPVNAARIVRRFREDTLRLIEEEPNRLLEIPGIGEKKVSVIKAAWQTQKEIKNVMIFLQSHNVSTSFSVKIYKTYGNDSIDIVTTNPYRLADDIWGIGFQTADKIATQLGFDSHSPERRRSGILYVLSQLTNDGHCFSLQEDLLKEGETLLGIDSALLEETISAMIAQNDIIADPPESLYLPPLYFSELGTARRLREIIDAPHCLPPVSVKDIIGKVEQEQGIAYDAVQKSAIEAAYKAKVMVLTGGPGTGKTTTTLAILRMFHKLGKQVLLAAPTGRAAKRLSETTGMEAKTIHRLLEFKPTEGYVRNETNPLECDVLIVDECSMIDIVLMYNLVKAVANPTCLVFVGDVDQLPSVGAGNVLKDMIESGTLEVVRLKQIFRQAQGSAIITNAHRINQGEFPNLRGGKDSDFFFIEEEQPAQIAETIRDLCQRRLPSYYSVDPVDDIQVLCPMQRGDTGAHNLNLLLQDALNPSTHSIRYGATTYRLHDKVMQIKNNYEKNVFNGDIGRITAVDSEEKNLLINFDGLDVEYDISELDEVVLAYATTIHKSQGSEYKIVVAPLTLQHYIMLQRNLLYTCITRAKQILILVGTKKAIAMAVSNNQMQKRNTLLAQRLANPISTQNSPA